MCLLFLFLCFASPEDFTVWLAVSEKASAAAKAAKEKGAEALDKAKEKGSEALDKAKASAADYADKAKATAADLAEKAKETASDLKDKAADKADDLRERFDPNRNEDLEDLIAAEQAKVENAAEEAAEAQKSGLYFLRYLSTMLCTAVCNYQDNQVSF